MIGIIPLGIISLLLLHITLSWNLTLKQTPGILVKTERYKHRLGFMQNINKDRKNVAKTEIYISISGSLFLDLRKVPFAPTISLSPCYFLI